MPGDVLDDTKASRGADGATDLVPTLWRVVGRRRETSDVTTLSLAPVDTGLPTFQCGQFDMLSALGVGEIAISVSSAPSQVGLIEHTIRDVGPVSHALTTLDVDDLVGVRGPFGSSWRVTDDDWLADRDIVVVAGGIGLAPLRGAVIELLARQTHRGGRIVVLVGAREPGQIVFADDLSQWSAMGAHVALTVDRAGADWGGHVGLVTTLLSDALFDPSRAIALMCGPEIMMRFSAQALVELGVDPARILVSLERNMQCGLGWCGHCQLGPFLLCRDGPVLPYAGVVRHLLGERER